MEVIVACGHHIEWDVAGGIENGVCAHFEHGSAVTFQLTIEVSMNPLAHILQVVHDRSAVTGCKVSQLSRFFVKIV